MDDGRWVTIAGQHIFLEKGEKPMNAYIKHMAKKRRKGEKSSIEVEMLKMDREKEQRKGDLPEEKTDKLISSPLDKIEDIDRSKENRFRVSDPFILYGEKTGTPVTKEEMVKYYTKKGMKTLDDDLIENAEKYADAYVKYRKELEKKRKK